jgi:hypothetical protein
MKESATKAMGTWETVIHPSPELMMDIDFIYFAGQHLAHVRIAVGSAKSG